MKAQAWLFTAAALWIGLTATAAAQKSEPGAPERLTVTIYTTQTSAQISKYLYGGFMEHGGAYYRVVSADSGEALWCGAANARKWLGSPRPSDGPMGSNAPHPASSSQ